MSNIFSHKIKWTIAGFFIGIFLTIYYPRILLLNKTKTDENDQRPITHYKFAEYSKWSPFLTDASFDLV